MRTRRANIIQAYSMPPDCKVRKLRTEDFENLIVMGDTRIFNSIPILLSADTYFDTKMNTKFQFSIQEVST